MYVGIYETWSDDTTRYIQFLGTGGKRCVGSQYFCDVLSVDEEFTS
jgi:hypothetical protein